MSSLIKSARTALLRRVNLFRLRSVAASASSDARLAVFVIASPPDMHLAPLAVLQSRPCIRHIILGNGISAADAQWLESQVGGVPVVRLQASLRNNAATYLAHAEVIELCATTSASDFGIQDADCFVIEPAWWDGFRIGSPVEYAAAPFWKPVQALRASMPDTYLVLIKGANYRRRETENIGPDISRDVAPLGPRLSARGLTLPYFPETGKDYFDTLQKHWLAAVLDGESLRELPGADEVVFHVGGSTYLTGRECADVAHWDYWPLNTGYFHMRVLESPRLAQFRPRFGRLFQRYGSSDNLLKAYPGFKQSKRFRMSERLLDFFKKFLTAEAS